ncbi:hypothetical protein BDA99DRAFT_296596 [Phascolomyces articulosus]|uniref:DNA mismatch repair protein PMS1 n=1 Tax=Phascolomyces articulosus TaxID=60185 RepID=A0AAD5JVY1_9FUNG|nr:hypothetical protein BDA99DRAFT_296596 [Phascolomyces articulosus]
MSAISAIDKQTVHRICSGQVVLDLAMAIKELVENSLDAGATSIEIKFKENGIENLEVIDNGCGISPENYESLALKHYTSKIKRFEDLESVTTFGFRGEALSSLCALCEVTVTTATSDQAPRGVKLVYDAEGHLVSQTPIARAMGTTIQLSKFFHALPVRQQEFKRNIKREYGKALAIIQAYGIIAKNTKITAMNQLSRGATTRSIATSGNKAVRENISNIFGVKTLSQIMLFQVDLRTALNQDNHHGNNIESEIQPIIHGFISKPEFGYGRSSGDRQYFFINGRPCVLPKLSKAFNELYRSFVTNQYPFIVADIRLPTNLYDVNVTPDKRTILLHDEQRIIEFIINDLREQLEPSRSTFTVGSFIASSQRQDSIDTLPDATCVEPVDPISNPMETDMLQEDDTTLSTPTSPTARVTIAPQISSSRPKAPVTRASLASFTYSNQRTSSSSSTMNGRKRINSTTIMDFMNKRSRSNEQRNSETQRNGLIDREEEVDDELADEDGDVPMSVTTTKTTIDLPLSSSSPSEVQAFQQSKVNKNEKDANLARVAIQDNESVIFGTPGPWYTRCMTRSISIRPDVCNNSINKPLRYSNTDASSTSDTAATSVTTFDDANLTNTDDNEAATAVLSRVITKVDFAKMKVIGQFNLGFIITMLDDDLFIVDQHASDEKYNFETLQLTTIIDGQRLIRPQNPDLTVAEELVAIENAEILRANGFELEIDPDKEPTQRIRVVSQPISRNVLFDKRDFSELVFALSERPGRMVRCSRARAMFASRACRSSVMIGHCLNIRKMCQIVQHMGEIDQPWNCPHGRPTMRHLCSITKTRTPRKKERSIECKGSLFR